MKSFSNQHWIMEVDGQRHGLHRPPSPTWWLTQHRRLAENASWMDDWMGLWGVLVAALLSKAGYRSRLWGCCCVVLQLYI